MTPDLIMGITALIVGWTIFSTVINVSIMVFMDPGDLMYGTKRHMVSMTKGKAGVKRFFKAIGVMSILIIAFYFANLHEAGIAMLFYMIVYCVFFIWKRNTAISSAD